VSTASVLARRTGFRSVVVVTGHMTDAPDRRDARFPESETVRVSHVTGHDDDGTEARPPRKH
jgi:hypothetical protein